MENQPSISSDLIRGHIDTIILHSLLDGDKFAQQISDAVELKSENEYKINQATLYSSLKRLEGLKLVSSYWHDFEEGGRKYFQITEEGKKTVDENLSSWTYSRSIIDKLMNLSPTPVFKFENQVVDKPTTDETVKRIETECVLPKQLEDEKITEISLQKPNLNESTQMPVCDGTEQQSNEHERNFRNILNGLIGISLRVESEGQNELKPIETTDAEQPNKIDVVMKFNETIDETDYNANKINYNGKIDYGDLTLKAEREGYTIRISSKDSAKPIGNLLINKLNFATSTLIFVVALLELSALFLGFKENFVAPPVIALSLISVIQLIVFAVVYFARKEKLINGNITTDGIITSAIVAFNLIIITLAIDFLFELNLSDHVILLSALLIPVIYFVDTVLFFWFRFLLSKRKTFLTNK